MIFATSCTFRASPGRIAGARWKSPMVSVTWPKPELVVHLPFFAIGSGEQAEPTAPTPDAKLIRLKRLKKSARSWIFTRSVIGTFLMNDRSTSPKPGPLNLLRARLPFPVGHAEPPGAQNAAAFHHCTPGMVLSKLWLTPLNGSPIRSRPKRASSDGCPECQFMTLLTCQPLKTRFDQPEVAHGAFGTS